MQVNGLEKHAAASSGRRPLAAETLTQSHLPWPSPFAEDHGCVRRDTKKSTFLFVTQPALADYTLSHMHGVVITARDGLELPCYLSLPVLPDGQARPANRPCRNMLCGAPVSVSGRLLTARHGD
jgi:hypothetical protein